MSAGAPGRLLRLLHLLHGLAVTLLQWLYFTLGFTLFFAPAYLGAALGPAGRAGRFQRLNRLFYKGFFGLMSVLVPRFGVRCAPEVGRIHGAVVVCNHHSYFDPLLLISLLPWPVTLVKGRFFRVPVLSWVMRGAGYVPADTAGGRLAAQVYTRLAGLQRHLDRGGTLFVFPEGTRNPPGRLGEFLPGAFKLARRYHAPLELLYLRHTQLLFPPRSFLVRPWAARPVEVEHLGRLQPDYDAPGFKLEAWIREVRSIYLERVAREARAPGAS